MIIRTSKIVATLETMILTGAPIVAIRPRPVVGTTMKTTEITITTAMDSITTITEITIQIIKTRKTIIDDRMIKIKSTDKIKTTTTTTTGR